MEEQPEWAGIGVLVGSSKLIPFFSKSQAVVLDIQGGAQGCCWGVPLLELLRPNPMTNLSAGWLLLPGWLLRLDPSVGIPWRACVWLLPCVPTGRGFSSNVFVERGSFISEDPPQKHQSRWVFLSEEYGPQMARKAWQLGRLVRPRTHPCGSLASQKTGNTEMNSLIL